MYQLIYVSTATEKMSDAVLNNLLQQARKKNERLDITGMLLYFEGNFMQIIEGSESVIKELFEDIQKDVRHMGIITLEQGAIPRRSFRDWTMGFKKASLSELNNMPGYVNVTAENFVDHVVNTDNSALEILNNFRQNMQTRLS